MLADDDANVLFGYQRQLRKAFSVDTALDGVQVLAMLTDQGPYAVVVSDLKMSGMDGVQLLSQVKKLPSDTVQLRLTGYALCHPSSRPWLYDRTNARRRYMRRKPHNNG